MRDLIGQSLGRYHILEQLGEGGMATVYKAYDTRLERDVAIKIIRRKAFPEEHLEHMLKRFEREAKALARLSHPNIVKVHDYGEYEGAPYLVMEYLPMGTLKQRLGKPMAWEDTIRILLPIARALQYAHSEGMVHRDVKPSNILITRYGEPMLSDFGIAKILENEDTQTLTGTGMGVGTPEYMAPEQWTGQVTPQSDIYSLGVVLYELITGRKPYTADTPAAILLKQAAEPLPRPAQYVPGLPEAVEKLLLKALAKKSEDRFASMADMATALDDLLTGGRQAGKPAVALPVRKARSIEDTQATVEQQGTYGIALRGATRDRSTPAILPASQVERIPFNLAKKMRWLPRVIFWGAITMITLVVVLNIVDYLFVNPFSPLYNNRLDFRVIEENADRLDFELTYNIDPAFFPYGVDIVNSVAVSPWGPFINECDGMRMTTINPGVGTVILFLSNPCSYSEPITQTFMVQITIFVWNDPDRTDGVSINRYFWYLKKWDSDCSD